MISFQQKILPMISEEQTDFLKCKVCQKEFPRFDQRGFRNAGFTAHQNRCVEREYLLSHPIVDQHSPRQRFLLPAPPTSSTSNNRVTALRSSSSSPILPQQQQQQQQQQHYPASVHSFQAPLEDPFSLAGTNFHQPTQIAGFHYVPENVPIYGQNSTLINHRNESMTQNYAPAMPVSIYEMVFPVTHCDYCEPEYGLHQPNCLFLAEFLRQSGSIQSSQ